MVNSCQAALHTEIRDRLNRPAATFISKLTFWVMRLVSKLDAERRHTLAPLPGKVVFPPEVQSW
jgi:hypothetical protein